MKILTRFLFDATIYVGIYFAVYRIIPAPRRALPREGGETEKAMGVSLEEQETVIRIGRSDSFADIWSSDTLMMSRLDRLCGESPDYYKCIEVGKDLFSKEVVNKRYIVKGKKLVSFRSRPSAGREYSEEEKSVLRERLRLMREKKKEKNGNGAEAEQ